MMLISPHWSTSLKIKTSNPLGSAKVYMNPGSKNKIYPSNFSGLRHLKMNLNTKPTKVYLKNTEKTKITYC